MQEIKVLNGKLNLDSSKYRMPSNDFIDALNITRTNKEVIYNLKGNAVVSDPYLHLTGINKVIGHYEDVTRNRIYKFVWNSDLYNLVSYYDVPTATWVKVLQDRLDTNDIEILEFDPSYRINHIDIIYRDVEGDLLLWATGNATPKCLNVVSLVNGEYPTVKKSFIEMAKKPFLSPPTGVYGSDLDKGSNALKRFLFQFTARPVFDDFQKGTFSTYSKIPLPIGYYGSDNDIVTTSNNFITITVETGDADVAKIEIAMRNNIGNDWSDFVLIASLDKEQLNIPDNSTYQFLFYNDAIYPPIDVTEAIQLFDYVPLLAGTQALGNGNIPIYGDITEGYDNYPVEDLNVTITVENVKNIPPDTDPAAITYTQTNTGSAIDVIFTVSGTITTGTVYNIYAVISATFPPILLATYTSLPADTNADVRLGLYNSTSPSYQFSFNPNYRVLLPLSSYILYIDVIPGSAGGGTISTEKTHLWNSTYIYGLVYVDEQNRDMPGVTTYANPVSTDDDFVVTTPDISLDGADVETPVISASIYHLPPAGAVKYYWVRRRQTYGTFMMYMTCDFQSDADYYYFCLANIEAYKTANSQFNYSTAPITDESRIRVMAGVTAGAYDGDIWTQDYQILGTETKTLSGGASPANDKLFIKVKIPDSAPSPAYSANMLVMVYTPALNPSTLADSVYYEFGEAYDIYESGGIHYHRGGDIDQLGGQPATFTFEEGDVYFHQRSMYNELLSVPYATDTLNIMDANFSDFFNSAVNDNGRAQAIEVNARRQRNPVLVRFGGAFEAGTNINDINRFKFLNYDEYDRSFGIIRKMFIEGRRLFIFQQFETGVVPILTQIIKDTSGNPLQANSDILLNKIAYPYSGKHGIGDTPESFAYSKGAKYFTDSNKGEAIRLSQDGATVLSTLYKANTFFVEKLAAFGKGLDNGIVPVGEIYRGNPTVYGAFDTANDKYILCFESIARYYNPSILLFSQDAVTISFYETRTSMEGFESFYSFHPEMIGNLNTLLITFKNGELWLHNNDFNLFYGIRYDSYITPVFNQNEMDKKTFTALEEIASKTWDCPEIITASDEYGTTKQLSNLVVADFEEFEGNHNAAFLGASNSIGGIINGSSLKGNLCSIKFRTQMPTQLVTLELLKVISINSPLNAK